MHQFTLPWQLGILNRYFGNGVEYEEKKKDFEAATNRIFTGFSAFIISDYVPWLSFVPRLQGWHSEFEDIRQCEFSFLNEMCELEKHREQAKVRLEKNDEDYVPDFVDLLWTIPRDDGKTLPDNEILANLMVRIQPDSSLCNQFFFSLVGVVVTWLATDAFSILLMLPRTVWRTCLYLEEKSNPMISHLFPNKC